MTPTQIGDEWFVFYTAGGERLSQGPFRSNGEAWRWIDRYEGSPISPAEKKSEWITDQILGGAT